MPETNAFSLSERGSYKEALKALRTIENRRTLLLSEAELLVDLLRRNCLTDEAIIRGEELLTNKALSVTQRCSIKQLLGYSYFRKGDKVQAIANYRSGMELAQNAGASLDECRLEVQLFANQIHWLGPQHAEADARLLQRKVHHAGDPELSLSFQLALAELGAKLGLTSRSRKHLETARALLPTITNPSLQRKFLHHEIALTAEEGDFELALTLSRELAKHEVAWHEDPNFATLVAHICISQARFQEAEQWLDRGFRDSDLSGAAAIAHWDTMLLLRIYQDRAAESTPILQRIAQIIQDTGDRDSFFSRWHTLTKAGALYKLGRVQEALDAARSDEERALRVGDVPMVERLRLTILEGLVLQGDTFNSFTVLDQLLTSASQLPPEGLAERCRGFALACAASDPSLARSFRGWSRQIFETLGNIGAAQERHPILEKLDSKQSAPHPGTTTIQPVNRIALILDSGDHRLLLGEQTLALLADSGAIKSAAIFAISDDGRSTALKSTSPAAADWSDSKDQPFEISLGTYRNKSLAIRGVGKGQPEHRITLFAIQRIAQTAVVAARERETVRELKTAWSEETPEQQLGLIFASERMGELLKTVRRVASTNMTVLLVGETGVGKELFARALHQASPRNGRAFLPFNCTASSRDMMESQLFGHRRGAFTGAVDDAPGIIRGAAGGTLFLDEIGEMSLEAQPKLLRFLESGEVLPVGHHKPEIADVRVVAATNADLDQMVKGGRFREDLYYRLNVIRIVIPPLRERREEIPLLVDHFLDLHSRELHRPMPRVADETLEYLVLYRWPGNVRQLANELRRMVALTEPGAILMPAHLSSEIVASRRTVPTGRPIVAANEVLARIDQPLSAAIEHIERAAIQRALAVCEGHMDDAAKMLGLSRKGLYLKRQRLKIDDPPLAPTAAV